MTCLQSGQWENPASLRSSSSCCPVSFCCSLTNLIWGACNVASCQMFSLGRSSLGFSFCCSCGFDHGFTFSWRIRQMFLAQPSSPLKWCSGSAMQPQEGLSGKRKCRGREAAATRLMPHGTDKLWVSQGCAACSIHSSYPLQWFVRGLGSCSSVKQWLL